MRTRRRDPEDAAHKAVWSNPAGFTRTARRAAGHRAPVSLLTEEHDGLVVDQAGSLPRYVRRQGMQALTAGTKTRRNRKRIARVERAMRPLGIVPV